MLSILHRGQLLIVFLLCRFSSQPLTIVGVTGPFCVLSENIYSLCVDSFDVSLPWLNFSPSYFDRI